MIQEIKESSKPLTSKDIEKFESKNKILLPAEYKEFLLKYNGGNPKLHIFYCEQEQGLFLRDPKNMNEKLVSIGIYHFYNLNEIQKEMKIIHKNKKYFNVMIPIASESSNFQPICISTNEKDYGSIYFLDFYNNKIYFICKSFNDFFNNLEFLRYDTKLQTLLSQNRYEEAIEYVSSDIDINSKNEAGHSLLMISIHYLDSSEVTKILLQRGADINGATYRALNSFNPEMAEVLISQYKGDINEIFNGTTALIENAKKPNIPMVKFILEKGGDVNINDNHGKKAIDYVEPKAKYDSRFKEIYKLLKESEEKQK